MAAGPVGDGGGRQVPPGRWSRPAGSAGAALLGAGAGLPAAILKAAPRAGSFRSGGTGGGGGCGGYAAAAGGNRAARRLSVALSRQLTPRRGWRSLLGAGQGEPRWRREAAVARQPFFQQQWWRSPRLGWCLSLARAAASEGGAAVVAGRRMATGEPGGTGGSGGRGFCSLCVGLWLSSLREQQRVGGCCFAPRQGSEIRRASDSGSRS